MVIVRQEPPEGPVSRENHMDSSLVGSFEQDGYEGERWDCPVPDRNSIIHSLEITWTIWIQQGWGDFAISFELSQVKI